MKKALMFVIAILACVSVVLAVEWSFPVSYKIGDIVTYQGKTYECLQAHTSQAGWNPLVVPALWKEIVTPPNDGTWQPNINYKIGDEVLYNNVQYIVRQAHRSQNDWTPDIVPALFLENIPSSYKNVLITKVKNKFGDKLQGWDIIDVDSSVKIISYSVTVKNKLTGEEKKMTWLDVN